MGGLTRRHIPNCITVFRVILLAPIYYCLINKHFGWALLFFAVAGLSDAVDGFLARRFNWKSRFGSIADPAADKLLIVLTFIGLTWVGAIPLWLTLVIILRDLVIVSGACVYRYLIGPFAMKPSMISKVNTGTQLAFLIVVLLNLSVWLMANWFLTFAIGCVFTTSILSGVDYVWVWGQKTRQEWSKRHE